MFIRHTFKHARLPAAIALTFVWGIASAQGWYLGAGAGQSILEDDTVLTGTDIDDKDTGWKAYGGYQFHDSPFALEFGYVDFGEFKSSINRWEPQAAYLDVVAGMPFTNEFGGFLKLGAARSRVEDTLAGTARRYNTDVTFGVGAQYDFTKNVGARLEWERFAKVGETDGTEHSDVDLVSASVVVRFR